MGKLLHEKLCYEIRGAVFDVANKYGKGLKEIIYEKALAEQFDIRGIIYDRQKRIDIYSVDTGKKLGTYVPDIIVADKIILELKASNFVGQQDEKQQQSYLKASKYEVAFLINFGTPQLYIKRQIFTNDRKPHIREYP